MFRCPSCIPIMDGYISTATNKAQLVASACIAVIILCESTPCNLIIIDIQSLHRCYQPLITRPAIWRNNFTWPITLFTSVFKQQFPNISLIRREGGPNNSGISNTAVNNNQKCWKVGWRSVYSTKWIVFYMTPHKIHSIPPLAPLFPTLFWSEFMFHVLHSKVFAQHQNRQ